MAGTSYDTIVVGSGPGGCVVARRLADAGQNVALVEAGPRSDLPQNLRGLSAVGGHASGALTWPDLVAYYGRALPIAAPRYQQGRALGGSSAINSMVLSPGDIDDYVEWQDRAGCVDWGPDAMRPWLDQAASVLPSQRAIPGPVTEAVMSRVSENQYQPDRDSLRRSSSLDLDAVGLVDASLAASDGTRCTVFEGLVINRPDTAKGSISVYADTVVSRVKVRGTIATGVETNQGLVLRAKTVVLAAGAIGTPKLLARSVPEPHHVGKTIFDHPSFAFSVCGPDATASTSVGGLDSSPSAISQIYRFASDGDDSRPGDIQVLVIEDVVPVEALSVVLVTLLSPNSTGRMDLSLGSDLKIERGCLTSASDRTRFRSGVRRVAAALVAGDQSDSIRRVMIDDKGTSATSIDGMSDDELDRWLLAHPGPVAHLAGACRMGPSLDGGAVVSSEPEVAGQVFGLSGLYIADSSVLPGLTSGGLQIPVMAVSERIVAGILMS